MNPEVKEIWLEALRSGLYQQGRSLLKYKNNRSGEMFYCCLGVLSDLAEKQGVVSCWADIASYKSYGGTETVYCFGEHARACLPQEVMDWAGIDTPFGELATPLDDIYNSLSSVNDAGMSFLQVADIIEEQF